MRLPAIAALVLLLSACGSRASDTPQAATERAIKLAVKRDKIGFARTLAASARGGATADIQLEILSEWLWLRSFDGMGLGEATLESWDPPEVTPGNKPTVQVTTTLHFRHPTAPNERPLAIEVELVKEGS